MKEEFMFSGSGGADGIGVSTNGSQFSSKNEDFMPFITLSSDSESIL